MGMVGSILMALGTAIAVGQDPVEKKVFTLPRVLEAVGKGIDQPMPAGLTVSDQKSYAAQTEWLKTVRTRIEPLAEKYDVKAPRDAATGQASGKRQHGPGPILKEWGPLQKTIEQESQQFSTMNPVLKTRHDMAMSAIRNMKA